MNEKPVPIVCIPAFEPDEALPNLIDDLCREFEEPKIIVVDDGSRNGEKIFEQCGRRKNVVILRHEKNRGKGTSLKTAFKYAKSRDFGGIVLTADSDGQHKACDIRRLYEKCLETRPADCGKFLALGCRKFNDGTPNRSADGNNAAKFYFKILFGKDLADTQTGMRSFFSDSLAFFANVGGSRYEYETNVLCEAVRNDFEIREAEIQTIYFDENASSHFKPAIDGTRIAVAMSKFALPTLISLAVNAVCLACKANPAVSVASSLASCAILNATGLLFGNKNFLKSPSRRKKFFAIFTLAAASSFAVGKILPPAPALLALISIAASNIFKK